jgi:hypothetical protein
MAFPVVAAGSINRIVPIKINSANPVMVVRAGERTMDFEIPMAQSIAERFGKRRYPWNCADANSGSLRKTSCFNQISRKNTRQFLHGRENRGQNGHGGKGTGLRLRVVQGFPLILE